MGKESYLERETGLEPATLCLEGLDRAICIYANPKSPISVCFEPLSPEAMTLISRVDCARGNLAQEWGWVVAHQRPFDDGCEHAVARALKPSRDQPTRS